MHHRETVTTTNTARIAHKLLSQSEIHLRGRIDEKLSQEMVFKKGYTPVYLYPSEKAQLLTEETLKTLARPIQLIVPDGSWRQTRRVSKREKYLEDILHVKLALEKPSLFFLRRKVKNEGMSTLEAIARSLGVLESREIQEKMENVFRIMVERTLETRGKKLS